MTEEQENLLVSIRDALLAKPDYPRYSDYENGLMSRDEYNKLEFQHTLVEDIERILKGEWHE